MKTSFIFLLIVVGLGLGSTTSLAGDAQKTQKLLAILKSDAAFYDKARACQQLGEVGTPEAVPALASVLGDEHLSAYARSGLEGIGGPEACNALRRALGTVKGAQRLGVIDSLGVLSDTNAIPVLIQIAGESQSEPEACAALKALGCMGTEDTTKALLKSLSSTIASIRMAGASGCLLAAKQLRERAPMSVVLSLYQAVTKADLPASYRIAGIHDYCLVCKSGAPDYMVDLLQTNDPVGHLAVFTTIRDMPSTRLADALNAVYPKLQPELQRQLLLAFADCHSAGSLDILRAATSAADPAQREAALTVLGRIGGRAEAETLCSVLDSPRSPSDASLAQAGLQQMDDTNVDTVLIKRLPLTTQSATQIALIHILSNRKTAAATPVLLTLATNGEPDVSVAALGALGQLAQVSDLDKLLSLATTAGNASVQKEAQTALANACLRLGDPACQLVIAFLDKTDVPAQKRVVARVLASASNARALPALRALATGKDESLGLDVIQALSQWQDSAPVELLLSVDANSAGRNRQIQARVTALKLIASAVDEHQMSDAVALDWLTRAKSPEDPVVSKDSIQVLGQLKSTAAYGALKAYESDTANHEAYASALIAMAPALVKSDAAAELKQRLLRLAAEPNPGVAEAAKKIAGQIP